MQIRKNSTFTVHHTSQYLYKTIASIIFLWTTSQYFDLMVDMCSLLITSTRQYFVWLRVISEEKNIIVV
jgi:hypothetical protein